MSYVSISVSAADRTDGMSRQSFTTKDRDEAIEFLESFTVDDAEVEGEDDEEDTDAEAEAEAEGLETEDKDVEVEDGGSGKEKSG